MIALGGAGGMGRRAVELLSADLDGEIVVADRDRAAAERVVGQVAGRAAATPARIDVRDHDGLVELFEGADLVMNTVGPFARFAGMVVEAALEAKVDYCDIDDDWEPTRDTFDRHSRAAEEAGVCLLVGMGASPGLSNLLARHAYERLDRCDELHTAWTAGGADGSGDDEPSAALEHMLLGAAGEIPVWSGDDWEDIPSFRDEVEVRFPVTGTSTLRPIGHPEPITLPRFLPGLSRSVNYGALAPSGLNELVRFEADRIEAGECSGVEAAADFMRRASDQPERWLQDDGGQGGLCAIAVGELDGSRVRLTVTCGGFPGGGMGGVTGYPLAIAARMLLDGEVDAAGVLAPEGAIDPTTFMERLSPTWELRLGEGLFLEEIEDL